MSFLLAPKKELKKTSTPLHLSPIWESSNSDLQKPQILLCFGIAGRRDIFFYMLRQSMKRQSWNANHQCGSRQIRLANPEGAKAWEPTLMKPGNRRVCAIFSCPPNIGGGSRKGWMLLLVLFFAPKKRTEWVWGIPRNKKKVTWFQCSNVVRSILQHSEVKALCLLAYPFE